MQYDNVYPVVVYQYQFDVNLVPKTVISTSTLAWIVACCSTCLVLGRYAKHSKTPHSPSQDAAQTLLACSFYMMGHTWFHVFASDISSLSRLVMDANKHLPVTTQEAGQQHIVSQQPSPWHQVLCHLQSVHTGPGCRPWGRPWRRSPSGSLACQSLAQCALHAALCNSAWSPARRL